MSKLTEIPPLGIEEVEFFYRICYPVWNGKPFSHDPRYRALFEGSDSSQPTPSILVPEVLVLLILIPILRRKRII